MSTRWICYDPWRPRTPSQGIWASLRVVLVSAQMRKLLVGIAPALLSVAAGLAHAQAEREDPAEFRVVVEVRGKREWGRRDLSRQLRRTLADEIGELRSSLAFRRAQRDLGIPPRRQTYPSRLARTGRTIGADYVIFVRLATRSSTRGASRDRLEAKGYLIPTESGKVQYRTRVSFASVDEASAAGRTLAEQFVEALRARAAPALAEAAPPADEAAPPPPDLGLPPNADEPPPPPTADNSDIEAISRRAKKTNEALIVPQDPTDLEKPGNALRSRLPALPARLTAPGADVSVETQVQPRSPPSSTLRIGVSLGSGVFRDYAVSSDAGDSALSYDVPLVFLLGLAAELDLPYTRFGLNLSGIVRNVTYEIAADGGDSNPGGLLIDIRLDATYRLLLTRKISLLPQAGLRFSRANVDDHAESVVLSTTVLAPFVGLRAVWGHIGGIQGSAGFDLGLITTYNESPGRTGDSPVGLTTGFDLGGRLWLSDAWAITGDTRVSYDQLGFSGPPNRSLQRSEADLFRDANVSVVDVTVRFGILLSL